MIYLHHHSGAITQATSHVPSPARQADVFHSVTLGNKVVSIAF